MTIIATQPGPRARAETMVDEDIRVIVSHSIGTLFSYMALCNPPHWPVHTFVTLGPRVEEFFIDNGHRAHDPEPYLNAAVTGAAVAAALR